MAQSEILLNSLCLVSGRQPRDSRTKTTRRTTGQCCGDSGGSSSNSILMSYRMLQSLLHDLRVASMSHGGKGARARSTNPLCQLALERDGSKLAPVHLGCSQLRKHLRCRRLPLPEKWMLSNADDMSGKFGELINGGVEGGVKRITQTVFAPFLPRDNV